MKKAKKIASLVVASALLTSSFAAITSVNAAEVDSAQTASADSTLVSKSRRRMLHAFNWSYNTIKKTFRNCSGTGTQQFRLLPFSSQRTTQLRRCNRSVVEALSADQLPYCRGVMARHKG